MVESSNPTLFINHFKTANTGPMCYTVNKLRTTDKTKQQKN